MQKKNTLAKDIKRDFPLYLMMLPAVIYVFINNYLPMSGIILAFEKYTLQGGIWGSEKVGLANFEFLLKNGNIGSILRNTVGYNVLFLVVNLIVSVIISILITEIQSKKFRKMSQSIILFPYVLSIIIISYMVRCFLDPENGLLNHLLIALGHDPVSWYSESKYWPFILTFVNTWKGIGYGCLVYIATILGIDKSLYEAAALDGASKFQQIRHITLPFLKPTIITMLLISMGRIFSSDFGLFYQVPQNSGMLMDVTQTIDTFVYRGLSTAGNMGMSAAAGLFQSLAGFIFLLVFNSITNKVSKENALF